MKFGLTHSELQYIRQEVIQPLREAGISVWCFGSRATGSNRKFSGLDLLLEASTITGNQRRLLAQIREKVEEGNFPNKVDFVFSQDLAESYRQKIMQERQRFDSEIAEAEDS